MSTPEFRVREAAWPADRTALRAVRETVFMREQGVSAELEWDGRDADARHLLAEDPDGQPIGCARLLEDGHIGRMAVLKAWRQCGVGSALLAAAMGLAARQGHCTVHLDAQLQAIPFYERHGFIAEGEVFMDAGIPHRRMRCVFSALE